MKKENVNIKLPEDTMENIPEFYILGLPVETELGLIYPIKVKQYLKLAKYIQILSLEDWQFKKMINFDNINDNEFLSFIRDSHFFYIINMFKDSGAKESVLYEIYQHYKDLFKFCFREDVFDLIETSEDFDYYREQIIKINGIKIDRVNPNPEIERYNQLKKLLDAKRGDTITFKAMYTSVLVATGHNPNELTLYQFHEVFDRISHFKNFDVTTMYRIVDNEIKVHNWTAETKEEAPKLISKKEFDRMAKSKGKKM